ncbi:phosphotransferase [Rhodohalobacter sp. SW132]|uniref:phosphotransferase n=1 Tax=Rhodohalobacter sp. SW132 TaxID=2293433 RepID=UPI0013156B53|nr:phosphotransferase [Rhodohalobacter sp. SW132]
MSLYEHMIHLYDKDIDLYSQKSCLTAKFTGTGYGGINMNSYRILEFKENTLFEKIYFKSWVDDIIIFTKEVLPEVLTQGINTPKLIESKEGENFFITYFEYLELEPLNHTNFLNEATDIAASIANVKLDPAIEFPDGRLHYHKSSFKGKLDNLKKELTPYMSDISNFLNTVDDYINKNVRKTLNHGDLSERNAFKNGKVIDWDNFGLYPLGYDFGKTIGMSEIYKKNELSLQDYLKIEDMIFKKVENLLTRELLEISLPYFTVIFLRHYRVRSRYNDINSISRELLELLKNRLAKLSKVGSHDSL